MVFDGFLFSWAQVSNLGLELGLIPLELSFGFQEGLGLVLPFGFPHFFHGLMAG